ncbi:MarR family transcriptional regulator [Phycicoccus sp. HDW14]|uniref:MarR family winged helix-turn-helix transcriptional regulator n=1 Tax=Phycicoccus sp. HDW14 TaxID=2714941 RepID=UPI00140C6D4C|nr:MarR family transcriptional regulator [Phycicoccus sp. HDW14]QIM21871.1 MarR family transcriptional regulator [Phycicoccus sp. HDW14]
MTTPHEDWSLGRLLSTAARMVEHDWNAWLAGHDLTHAGFLALHGLASGPLPQRELAAASHVEEQTMARIVDRLERTGHVTRRRDPRDRRRVLVERTDLGASAHAAVQASGVADRLVEGPLADAAAFRAELVRLVAARRTPPASP